MTDIKKNNHSVRFFSNSCVDQKLQNKSEQTNDPIPFGMNFQEPFPDIDKMTKTNAITFAQSPTQTPTGPDTVADIDIQV